MNEFTVFYKVRFNVGKFKGKIEDVVVELSDHEIDSLSQILVDRDYIKFVVVAPTF